MQTALQRQAGVAKVDVNLLRGNIVVYPRAEFNLDPLKIMKLIKDSGVSLRQMNIVAEGIVARTPEGNPIFRVTESNQEFLIVEDAKWEAIRGQVSDTPLLVTGTIFREADYKKRKKAKQPEPPPSIELVEVVEKR